MSQYASDPQLSDLITEIETIEGVCFDPQSVSLHGLYNDELSAHRARKGWIEVLDSSFFLEPEVDYAIKVLGDLRRGRYVLSCEFTSASARYAFWRLTHQQAPEAQYLIETAHLPTSDRGTDLASAPDLTPLVEDPSSLENFSTSIERRNVFARMLDSIFRGTDKGA